MQLGKHNNNIGYMQPSLKYSDCNCKLHYKGTSREKGSFGFRTLEQCCMVTILKVILSPTKYTWFPQITLLPI